MCDDNDDDDEGGGGRASLSLSTSSSFFSCCSCCFSPSSSSSSPPSLSGLEGVSNRTRSARPSPKRRPEGTRRLAFKADFVCACVCVCVCGSLLLLFGGLVVVGRPWPVWGLSSWGVCVWVGGGAGVEGVGLVLVVVVVVVAVLLPSSSSCDRGEVVLRVLLRVGCGMVVEASGA